MPNTNDSQNVTTSRPKVGGAVFTAPLGTALPTSATAALAAAFENMGYVSEDGFTNATSADSEEFNDWNGDVVDSSQTSHSETYALKFIERNATVLKSVYGDANVTVGGDGSVTVQHTSADREHRCFVIDEMLKGDRINRTVIPDGKITEVGDVVHKKSELLGFDSTITAFPDASGVKAYEYTEPPEAVG